MLYVYTGELKNPCEGCHLNGVCEIKGQCDTLYEHDIKKSLLSQMKPVTAEEIDRLIAEWLEPVTPIFGYDAKVAEPRKVYGVKASEFIIKKLEGK